MVARGHTRQRMCLGPEAAKDGTVQATASIVFRHLRSGEAERAEKNPRVARDLECALPSNPRIGKQRDRTVLSRSGASGPRRKNRYRSETGKTFCRSSSGGWRVPCEIQNSNCRKSTTGAVLQGLRIARESKAEAGNTK